MSARELVQLDLFEENPFITRRKVQLDLQELLSYDKAAVCLSGGKDSIACLLHLLEIGYPKDRIELHHHLVDGRESGHFMDYPVTESYCRAIAAHFGIPLYMSWREGGFLKEMLRENEATAAMLYETPSGAIGRAGGESKNRSTRRKFPQLSASLTTRWCSGSLKVSVLAACIAGQERFHNNRTLVITGERAQESANRARYAMLEPHRTDARMGKLKRTVDHYRPILWWTEQEVWAIIQRHGLRPHDAYFAGWNRLSCAQCSQAIF